MVKVPIVEPDTVIVDVANQPLGGFTLAGLKLTVKPAGAWAESATVPGELRLEIIMVEVLEVPA
jgi:hypothetical protein